MGENIAGDWTREIRTLNGHVQWDAGCGAKDRNEKVYEISKREFEMGSIIR